MRKPEDTIPADYDQPIREGKLVPAELAGLQGISLLTTDEREAVLAAIPQTGLFVEIGTHHGVSMAYWAKHRPAVTFIGLDVYKEPRRQGSYDLGWKAARNWLLNRRPNMLIFVGPSSETAGYLALHNADVVLVDADHHYEGCSSDLESAGRLVDFTNGTILCHDFNGPKYHGVTRAVLEFCERESWRIAGVVDWLAILKRK